MRVQQLLNQENQQKAVSIASHSCQIKECMLKAMETEINANLKGKEWEKIQTDIAAVFLSEQSWNF